MLGRAPPQSNPYTQGNNQLPTDLFSNLGGPPMPREEEKKDAFAISEDHYGGSAA